jgi:enoyl-[acyl-carrier-protein] reductase (NADH)
MTYYGSQTVVKNYNIMGVAKAALEAAVRYLAAELGPKGIRVHAISPGPLATRAASGIPEFDELLDKAKSKAPTRSLVSIDDVGAATAFLAHDAARCRDTRIGEAAVWQNDDHRDGQTIEGGYRRGREMCVGLPLLR